MDPGDYLALMRGAWETVNRRDVETHLTLYDPEVAIRPAFAVGAEGDWLHGHEGVRRALDNVFEIYVSWEGAPEQVIAIRDHAVVVVRLDARGRASGVELSGLFAQVVTVRDGGILRLMNFLELPDAFEEMARLLRQTSG
jgi:ketosteroid isomerase-like protein